MKNHFELSDRELEFQFSNGTLDPELFSHEAHLRVTWIYISKYGITEALKSISFQLLNYVTNLGERNKYNATLTVAAIKIVHHFMLKSKTETFKEFILENHSLKDNFKELLNWHYTTNIIVSAEASHEYIAPDLLPFDKE